MDWTETDMVQKTVTVFAAVSKMSSDVGTTTTT